MLPYKSPLQPYVSWATLFVVSLVIIFSGTCFPFTSYVFRLLTYNVRVRCVHQRTLYRSRVFDLLPEHWDIHRYGTSVSVPIFSRLANVLFKHCTPSSRSSSSRKSSPHLRSTLRPSSQQYVEKRMPRRLRIRRCVFVFKVVDFSHEAIRDNPFRSKSIYA